MNDTHDRGCAAATNSSLIIGSAMAAAAAVSLVNSVSALRSGLPFAVSPALGLAFAGCSAAFFLLLGGAIGLAEAAALAVVLRALRGVLPPGTAGDAVRWGRRAVGAFAALMLFLAAGQRVARFAVSTFHDREIITFFVPAACLCLLAAAGLAAAFALRIAAASRSARVRGTALFMLLATGMISAAVLWTANRHWIPIVAGGYWTEIPLFICAQCACAAGMRGRARPTPAGVRRLLLLAAAASLVALAAVEYAMDLRYIVLNRRGPGAALYRLAVTATDRDRDGYSFLVGTRDPDDRNASVHPGAADLPRNGIDENCLLGDYQGWKPRAHVRPAPGGALRRIADRLAGWGRNAWWGIRRAAVLDFRGVAGAHPPRKVILVTIDAVRGSFLDDADGPPLMPRLREFAEEGIWFRRGYVPAPFTTLSLLGVFRSKYPMNLAYSMAGVRNWADLNPSLARVLKSRGFATVAVVPSDIFDCGEESLSSSEGFDAQAYPLTPDELWHNQAITSPAVSEMAKGFLETYARRDLFLWVHYYDPHQIYNAHPGFGDGASDFDRYRSEVRFTDHHLGEFLDYVTRRFGKDRASICVVADHGEAFGEHGTYFHGYGLFEEEIRVPFVMKLPSAPPSTVGVPVSLIDVAPTLVAALGMEPPPAWQGQDLMPLVRGDASGYRGAAFLNMEPLRGIVEWPYKMIWDVRQNWMGVYNLEDDPSERSNLYSPGDPTAARLKRGLEEWIEAELNPWTR